MKFIINMKLEDCDKRKKYVTYWTERKKKKKKKKTRTPAWESNVTTTAPANTVFKIECSFYIITFSS